MKPLIFGLLLIAFGFVLGSIYTVTPATALPIPFTPAPTPQPYIPLPRPPVDPVISGIVYPGSTLCPGGVCLNGQCGVAQSGVIAGPYTVTVGVSEESTIFGNGGFLGRGRGLLNRVAGIIPGHDRRVARRQSRRE